MKMISISRRLCLMLMLAIGLSGMTTCPIQAQEQGLLKEPVATVNGVELSRIEFENQVKNQTDRFISQGRTLSDVEMVILKQRILKNMIDRQLIYQQSQAEKIVPSAERVEKGLADLRSRFENDEAYERAMQGLRLTQAEIEEKIKQDVAIATFIDQKVAPDLEVTEAEMQAYFEKLKPKIKAKLLADKRGKQLETWLAEARKKADIKKNLNLSLPPTVMNPPKPAE